MMRKSNALTGNCWPTDNHLCLMQAALLDGNSAITAWEKWLVDLDIDKLDYPSYQIIPKLYKNLKRLNISHPHMKIFEGIYRRTWAENQRNFYMFSELVKSLRGNGVEDIVLLKGGAMMLSCYQDFGIRTMGDIDFLVSKQLAVKIMLLLIEWGFKIVPPSTQNDKEYLEDKIKMQHAINFIGENSIYNQLNIDLHWSILYEIADNNIDSDWITHSDTILLNGVKVSTLNATYLLYQTCVHGAKYSPVPLTRWVMDAVSLINLKGSHIDWDKLISSAKHDRQLLAIRDTFFYLRDYFGVFIPPHIMRYLEKNQFVLAEKVEFKLKNHAFWSVLLIPFWLWNEHSRTTKKRDLFSKILTFPVYLQKRCGMTQLWHLPFLLPIRILKSFRRRLLMSEG